MPKWLYRWESPDPKNWRSDRTYESYEAAKQNAIYNAVITRRKKKRRLVTELEKKQQVAVWRSLRRAGWRVRRKKVPETDVGPAP